MSMSILQLILLSVHVLTYGEAIGFGSGWHLKCAVILKEIVGIWKKTIGTT